MSFVASLDHPQLRPANGADRVSFMDCEFDSITESQAIEHCLRWRNGSRRSNMLVTVNVSILMMMRRDAKLREVCTNSELVVADGVPIVWGLKLLGTPLAGRVCGCDLMGRILAEGGQHNLRVFFLGAKEEVVTDLVQRVKHDHPGIEIVGYRNGYFSEDEHPEVIREIRESHADVLFIGMPTPFKETWAYEHRHELQTPAIIGVGGSFDVHAGYVTRAPQWMQKVGMEWFWRLLMEPRKMWRRYLVTNCTFIWLYAKLFLFGRGKAAIPASPTNSLTGPHLRQTSRNSVSEPATNGRASRAARLHIINGQTNGGHRNGTSHARVSVVVPCFNEESGVAQLADRLDQLKKTNADKYELEFILVDDGSSDRTWHRLRETFGDRHGYRLIRHARNRGIAAAIMTGVKEASAEIVCSIDSDCTYDPTQLGDMIPQLGDDFGMVTASPYHPHGAVHNVAAWRLKLSRTASAMYGALLNHKLHCYTSCFRVYRRSAVQRIELQFSGFVGVAELLWKVEANGHRIKEVPAVLTARNFGSSKMRLFRTTLGHLALMQRMLTARLRSAPPKAADQPAKLPNDSFEPAFAEQDAFEQESMSTEENAIVTST